MSDDRQFFVKQATKLDSPERQAQQPVRPLIDLLAHYRPQRLLEIGVGTGYVAIPFATQFPNTVVVGIDVESQTLEIFTERAADLTNIRVASTVPSRIPFLDDSVDTTLMVNLYHKLDDRSATLHEIRRVLSQEGILIICDWAPEHGTNAGPPKEICVPADCVERQLTSAGFDNITQRSLYKNFWVVTARR